MYLFTNRCSSNPCIMVLPSLTFVLLCSPFLSPLLHIAKWRFVVEGSVTPENRVRDLKSQWFHDFECEFVISVLSSWLPMTDFCSHSKLTSKHYCFCLLNSITKTDNQSLWMLMSEFSKSAVLWRHSLRRYTMFKIRLDYYQFTTSGRHTQKAKPVQGVRLQKNNKTNKYKEQLQNYIRSYKLHY